MKKINEIMDGEQLRGIYFCKEKRTGQTKAGKPFFSLTLQDNTGTLSAKIWDTESLILKRKILSTCRDRSLHI